MINLLIVSFCEEDKTKYGITSFHDDLDYAKITPNLDDDTIFRHVENRYGIPVGVMTTERYTISRFFEDEIRKVTIKPKET